jgi:glycosyl transferase, family 25
LSTKVYVINLDRHPDRLAHMREQLRGIRFERIAAVDGNESPKTVEGLSRFELACLASHRSVWRLFLNGPDQHACVLEDDLHLWPGFAALVNNEGWIPTDAHSVKLDTYFQKVKLGKRQAALADRQVARLYTRHQSSAAYLLTRSGAERYLELTEPPTLPADYSLFPKNPRLLGLVIYQLAPAVAIQDHLHRAENGGQTFATAMGGGGAAQTGRSPLGKLWREGARLAGQAGAVRESIYLKAALRAETTIVGVG